MGHGEGREETAIHLATIHHQDPEVAVTLWSIIFYVVSVYPTISYLGVPKEDPTKTTTNNIVTGVMAAKKDCFALLSDSK